MAYPTITYTYGSQEQHLDDIIVDRASNGVARARAFFTARKRKFDVAHEWVSAANKDTLIAYYDANRTAPFTFTWADGVAYTCLFVAPPNVVPNAGNLWHVTMHLEQQ